LPPVVPFGSMLISLRYSIRPTGKHIIIPVIEIIMPAVVVVVAKPVVDMRPTIATGVALGNTRLGKSYGCPRAAAAKSAIDVQTNAGDTLPDGMWVAPVPSLPWRRWIQTLGRLLAIAGA